MGVFGFNTPLQSPPPLEKSMRYKLGSLFDLDLTHRPLNSAAREKRRRSHMDTFE
jgi:hypothetical protein